MTPRQLAAAMHYAHRRKKRELAIQLSLLQVGTSQNKKVIQERLKELMKGSD